MTLDDYLSTLRGLVHDTEDRYWTSTQKKDALNSGIQQRDQDTGANRILVTFTLTVGTDTYTLSDVATGTSDARVTRAFDIVGINLLFNGVRIVLSQQSFTELNATWRPWTRNQWTPWAWTKYNPTTAVFAPTPAVAYDTEWDLSVIAPELTTGTETDPLTGIFTNPPPFYAAYLLKVNEAKYEEANWFLDQYHRLINNCQSAKAGMLVSPYRSR